MMAGLQTKTEQLAKGDEQVHDEPKVWKPIRASNMLQRPSPSSDRLSFADFAASDAFDACLAAERRACPDLGDEGLKAMAWTRWQQR